MCNVTQQPMRAAAGGGGHEWWITWYSTWHTLSCGPYHWTLVHQSKKKVGYENLKVAAIEKNGWWCMDHSGGDIFLSRSYCCIQKDFWWNNNVWIWSTMSGGGNITHNMIFGMGLLEIVTTSPPLIHYKSHFQILFPTNTRHICGYLGELNCLIHNDMFLLRLYIVTLNLKIFKIYQTDW